MEDMQEYLNSLTDQRDALTRAKSKGDPVKNRVLHIDGDFIAYMASFDETITFGSMCENLDTMLETFKLLAQAESFVIHLTPKGSNKGGRYDQAVFCEYQGTRKNVKPTQLENIRLYMANKHNAILHYTQEADDGLAQAVYADIVHNVILTKDKDLMMCAGLHLNWETGDIFEVTKDGTLYINDKGDVKGDGLLWLWYQMLAGDTADNIKGLPMLTRSWSNVVKPTKEIIEATDALINSTPDSNQEELQKYKDRLNNRKPVSCGSKTAYLILSKVSESSQEEICKLVRTLYNDYTKEFAPVHWKTQEPLKEDELFFSTGRLLFMRRTVDDTFDALVAELQEDATHDKG